MRRSAIALGALGAAACQPCEGPVVVTLAGMDATATVEWATMGGGATPCTPGLQDATWDCGPDRDDFAGTFTVVVRWNGLQATEQVTVESDDSCMANDRITVSSTDLARR